MTNRMLSVVLCSFLLVYLPFSSATIAAGPVMGQVMVKGPVKINGVVAPSGATLSGGDHVATDKNAMAELLLNGGTRVLLPESSAVVLSTDEAHTLVNLEQGALALVSQSSFPPFIDANGVRVKPSADKAVVEVSVLGNSLKVLAHRGWATVETANKTLEVAEGKELDATTGPPPAGAGPQGGAAAGAAGRSFLQTFVLIGSAAAGLTGLVLGAVASSRPNASSCTVVSPSGTLQCP